MASGTTQQPSPVNFVIVGASPQALPDLRTNPTFLFVDFPDEARESIPFSNDIRYLIFDKRMSQREREEVSKVAHQVTPYAEVVPVVSPRTLRDIIDSVADQPMKIPTIAQYAPLASDVLPPGISSDHGVLVIPWHRIRRFDENPRDYFDPDELNILAGSISLIGQVTPGLVRRLEDDPRFDYQLVDGERRWLACKIAQCDFRATLTIVKNSAEHFTKSAVANFGGAEHTPLEVAHALNKTRTLQRLTLNQLATVFTRSLGWVQQHLNLLKLDSEVQKLMASKGSKQKALKMAVALQLITYPKDFQVRMATEVVAKNLKFARANAYIRHEAIKAGLITERTKKRSPNKDLALLDGYLRRMADSSTLFLEMADKLFMSMFEHRMRSTRNGVVEAIERNISELVKLKKRVANAKSLNEY